MSNVQKAAKLAFHNANAIKISDKVGCYHCCKIFTKEEITEYTDEGKTAICPQCNIDAVIGSSQIEINEQFLVDSNKYWF